MDFRDEAREFFLRHCGATSPDKPVVDALVALLERAQLAPIGPSNAPPQRLPEATLTSCESRLGRLVEADRKLIQELQGKVIELERVKFNETRVRELVVEMTRGVKDELSELDADIADAEDRFDAAIKQFRSFRAWLTKPKRKPAAVSHPKGWGKPVGKGRRRASKPKGRKAKR